MYLRRNREASQLFEKGVNLVRVYHGLNKLGFVNNALRVVYPGSPWPGPPRSSPLLLRATTPGKKSCCGPLEEGETQHFAGEL